MGWLELFVLNVNCTMWFRFKLKSREGIEPVVFESKGCDE